jgi:ribonuclease HI
MRAISVDNVKFKPQISFHDSNALYVDGGVIGSNPSTLGGTFACRLIMGGDVVVCEHSGSFAPSEGMCPVSNNHSELMAMLEGLKILPWNWRGTIWSDSKVTLLRTFCQGAMNNVPQWMVDSLCNQQARLVHWNQIFYGLLAGHPTKAHLQSGIGHNGHPCSKHNLWCDTQCGKEAQEFYSVQEGVKA